MEKVAIYNLIETIQTDNLSLFSAYVKGNENICMGRFPLLTLCYMYNAKSILSRYRKDLAKISSYKFVEEPTILYKQFKSIVGKAIRFFKVDNSIVSPLEFLAASKQDSEVKKWYKCFVVSDELKASLKKIYAVDGIGVDFAVGKIKIQHRVLDVKEKKQHKLYAIFAAAAVVVVCSVYVVFGLNLGLGAVGVPFKISSAYQLSQALNTSGSYVLNKDIVIDDAKGIDRFDGEIDGNGHTIKINNLQNGYLLKINNGDIKNINIEYGDISKTISKSQSMFVATNNGSIENVNIVCGRLGFTCNKSDDTDIVVSGVAKENYGNIKDTSVLWNIKAVGVGDGECFVSGIAGNNYGEIDSCSTAENSSIELIEADGCGIAAYNNSGAIIKNCKNNSTISQVSDVGGWSPSVGGISVTNSGQIQNSYNYSNLAIDSNFDQVVIEGYIFIGGVSANNYGDIARCVNYGDIKVTSEVVAVYAGGISGYASWTTINDQRVYPTIVNCGVDCTLDVSTSKDTGLTFVGGISGFLYGDVKQCYSLATFTQGFDQKKYYVGTLLGASYIEFGFFNDDTLCFYADKNIVLYNENVSCQIGALINSGSIYAVDYVADTNEVQIVEDDALILQSEVYWNEKQ